MRVNFDGDDVCASIGFFASVLPDLAAKLVGLTAVHAPRLRSPFGPDLAQPLKEQNAAWIARANLGNLTGDLVSGVLVGLPDMPSEILIAAFPLDGFARLPLLFRNLL